MSESEFREFLRIERIRRRLTQKEFADKVGLSRNTISHIENGKQRVYLDQFLNVMNFIKANQV